MFLIILLSSLASQSISETKVQDAFFCIDLEKKIKSFRHKVIDAYLIHDSQTYYYKTESVVNLHLIYEYQCLGSDWKSFRKEAHKKTKEFKEEIKREKAKKRGQK